MLTHESPYIILGILNTVIAFGAALWILQRRPVQGVRTFAVAVLCLAGWSATDTFGRLSLSEAGKLFWLKASILPAVTSPVTFLAFVVRYGEPPRPLTRREVALLAIEPFLTMLLVWTNEAHGWMWRSTALASDATFSVLQVSHGPWFWIHVIYSYLLLAVSFLLLVSRLRQSSALYRRQGLLVLFGALAAWAANIVSSALPALGPLPTTLGIALTNGFIVWNLLRLRLFELVPVARATVLDQLGASVIVLDNHNRIVDLNRSAQALIGRSADQVLGKTTQQVFADYQTLLRQWHERLDAHEEIRWGPQEAQRWFDVRMSPLRDPRGDVAGRLVVLHEITERKLSEETLRRRTEELGVLQSTVLDITAPHDLPTLLQAIVERAAQLLHAPGGGMYLCDPAAREARCVVSYNTPEDYTGTVLRYGEGAAGTVAQTGQPLLIHDYRTWSKRAPAFEGDQPFSAVLSTPMIWKGQVIGVIHVLDTEEGRFRQEDLELLSLFASHAAIAVENARLLESLQGELAERGRLEAEIEQRRLYLESILASAPDAIVTLDSRLRIAEWNPGAERLFGYTADEVRGRDLDELITGENSQTHEQALSFTRKVLAGEPVPATEVVRYRKDGSPAQVIVAGSPIVRAGELLGVMATYTDLGELKSAEEALRRSEARYRSLFEDSPISLWEEDWSQVKAYVDDLRNRGVADLASYLEEHPDDVRRFPNWVEVLDVNRASLELYGARSKEELITSLGSVLSPESVPAHVDSLLAIAQGRTRFEHEIVNRTLWGERKLVHVTVQVVPGYESTWGKVLVSLVDITARERAEAEVQASLQEKEMLLREVHHRVKNTLQIVSSLLYLQSEQAGAGSAREVLQNSRDQVRSMALVHEKLYRSEDLARVDFSEYVSGLRTSLVQTYGAASRGIEVEVDVDAVLLDADLATPCGLIINELVSNALKHAFTGRDRGEVGIGFYADGDQYVLTVHDDGTGLPEDVDLQRPESLGLQVVASLVQQLDGTVQVDRQRGSRYTISFPASRDQVAEGAAS